MMADRTRGAGSRFGHYELRSLLGRGGMGEVYTAYDTVKDRTVALKLLPPDLAGDPAYQERFRREARTAARLQEPHIIPIHDFGEIDGTLFIDMRLVQGRDLKTILAGGGALQPQYAVSIVSQIASALDAAHADGLVHRDIKPANILVTPRGFAYLADFGIASRGTDSRMTEEGNALGSLPYMAPERFDNIAASVQSDIYALACVLFECLTGSKPYGGGDVSTVISGHMHGRPPSVRPYGVDPAFDTVLAQGLAKAPENRFRTAGALGRAAETVLRTEQTGSSTAPPSAGEMRTIPVRQGPVNGAAPMPMPVAGGRPPADRMPPGPRDDDRGKGNRGLWALAVVVAVIAIATVVLWLTRWGMGGEPSSAPSAPVTSAHAANATTAAPTTNVPQQTRTHETTSASPPSSATTSPTSTEPTTTEPATIAAGAGYDWQGWDDPRARCHVDDRAMLVAGSTSFRTVICETGSGRYYYRGFDVDSDGDPGIEIDDPRQVPGGWTVQNKGTTYDLVDDAITIIEPGGDRHHEAATAWAQVS